VIISLIGLGVYPDPADNFWFFPRIKYYTFDFGAAKINSLDGITLFADLLNDLIIK